MAKYFIDPFAIAGDRTAVPDAPPLDGSVSYDLGFGPKYQQDPSTTGLDIPRDQFNEIMYQVTLALQQYQQLGFPDFITSADNGGTPFPYAANATVRHSGVNYYSLIDTNVDTPPSANWGLVTYGVQAFRSGDAIETYDSVLPSGWLWMDGSTIGSVASGATGRANADTISLYTVLWNSISNAVLPIQDSGGSPTSRGASAAADFAANKRLPLIDKRGRIAAAADNMGGTAAGRLNNFAQGGVDGTILGNAGGEANHALSSNENGSHAHAVNRSVNGATTAIGSGTFHYYGDGAGGPQAVDGPTSSSGLGSAHNTVQPTVISYYRIKL